MAKVTIKAERGQFIATFEDGSLFGKGFYKTEGGAGKAVSRSGHTYEKPVEAVKVDKGTKTRKGKNRRKSTVNWDALKADSGHGENFWPAFSVGKALVKGYESKHVMPEGYTGELCVELYQWAQSVKGSYPKTEEALDLEPVKPVTAREALEATVAKAATWNAERANEKARELGFDSHKRPYRTL